MEIHRGLCLNLNAKLLQFHSLGFLMILFHLVKHFANAQYGPYIEIYKLLYINLIYLRKNITFISWVL